MDYSIAFIVGIMGFCWLLVVGSAALLPYYTKKSIAFGIAVPQEQYGSALLSMVRQQYVWGNLVFGAILMALGIWPLFHMREEVAALVSVGLIFLFMVISYVFYIRAYHQVKEFKRQSDWTISTVSSAQVVPLTDERALFSPWWYLTYLIPIAAITVISWIKYPSLPDMIPQNIDLDGTVISYAEKTMGTVFTMPLILLALTALFAFIGLMINRAKRQTDDPNIVRGLRNNRTFQIAMGKMMFWLGLAMILMMAGAQLSILGMLSALFSLWASIALLVFVLVVMVYLLFAIGQGGYRLGERQKAVTATSIDGHVIEGDVAEDDEHWILWGTFYNNPEDPSLFVQKRVGMGWTTNVGNPIGKWLMIITAALVVAFLVALPFLMMLET